MYRIYVNGSYICNTYYSEVANMIFDQLKSFGWRRLSISNRPRDVFLFTADIK